LREVGIGYEARSLREGLANTGKKQRALAGPSRFLAEREGFEPSIRVLPV